MAVACFLPGRAKDLPAPLYIETVCNLASIALTLKTQRRIVVTVASLTLHLSTLSRNCDEFRRKKHLTQNVCFDFLCNSRLKHLSLYEEFRQITLMCICLHVQYTIFYSDFNETRMFPTDFRKILKYQISGKSVNWETSCFMLADMTTPIVAFRNSANTPKSPSHLLKGKELVRPECRPYNGRFAHNFSSPSALPTVTPAAFPEIEQWAASYTNGFQETLSLCLIMHYIKHTWVQW